MINRLAASAATMTCVLTSLLLADIAHAAPIEPAAERTVRISTGDVNLASPEGATVLKRRIRGAAQLLCLSNSVEPLEDAATRKQCYRTAVADGARQMDRLIAMRMDRSTERLAELGGEAQAHRAG